MTNVDLLYQCINTVLYTDLTNLDIFAIFTAETVVTFNQVKHLTQDKETENNHSSTGLPVETV